MDAKRISCDHEAPVNAAEPDMHRITISLEDELAQQFDELMHERGYRNRSEAMRDLVRGFLDQERIRTESSRYCIASLSYVYNHHERDLARRLTSIQHAHHDLNLTTMHIHLDHDNCLETVVLRGKTADVKHFAEAIMAERGVRHGKVNLIAIDMEGTRAGGHSHVHLHPHT